MRLSNTPIGILFNFAPVKDQCEKYYYDLNNIPGILLPLTTKVGNVKL